MNRNRKSVKNSIILACALLGCANLFAGTDPARNVKIFSQMENPVKWTKNAAGKVQISFDKKESALVIDGVFAPNVDRWIYPEYRLQMPQESLKDAKTISFEWKIVAEKPLRMALAMLVTKAKTFNVTLPKQTGSWVKCSVSLDQKGLNKADITKIRIGMNPTCDHVKFYIRNIRILY